ncbi:response regulator [Dyadobacter sp. NIV53]|uniref:response regulator n=1 Tax=Dyadobacter sp. NIV53 TaxID=2861765 RepID=UPI001C8831AE|nr:response regulator [Dyadobacter sp. NIV53]
MSLKGPIILVEDDEDDQYLINKILEELQIPNTLRLHQNGLEALNYLKTTQEKPLLILCDVNMPVMNGLELRKEIEDNPYLKQKAIPFIFLSTSGDIGIVKEAYKGTIQGFYKKESNYSQYKNNVEVIIRYWQSCLHPNK